MKIKEILNDFKNKLNNVINEENKNKPTFFRVNWRCNSFDRQIDSKLSYWYFEDDGTIVFRVNDDIGIGDEYEMQTQTFQEFKEELEKFLEYYGKKEQGECEEEIQDNFFFFTTDDDISGSYWSVDDFSFIDDDDKVIIQINDWG